MPDMPHAREINNPAFTTLGAMPRPQHLRTGPLPDHGEPMTGFRTILLLVLSNVFMTLAWYGHLRVKDLSWGKGLGLMAIILISWGLAFFEYLLQVPANRYGHVGHGGPFTLVQLKVIQEIITLCVFAIFTLVAFREEALRWNHLLAALLLICAVWLVFKK